MVEFAYSLVVNYQSIKKIFASYNVKRVWVSPQRFYIVSPSFSLISQLSESLNKLFYPLTVSIYMYNKPYYTLEQYAFYYAVKYGNKDIVVSLYEKYPYTYFLISPYIDCKINYMPSLLNVSLENNNPLSISITNIKKRRQIINLLLQWGRKLTNNMLKLINKQGYELIRGKIWPIKSAGHILFKL
jgi:hypothetical protein